VNQQINIVRALLGQLGVNADENPPQRLDLLFRFSAMETAKSIRMVRHAGRIHRS
jgi:hypothetical protein